VRSARSSHRACARAAESAGARPACTSAGVISIATSSSDSTTITGTTSATSVSGAIRLPSPLTPAASNQPNSVIIQGQPFIDARSAATAASQYR
jgi:hypothetical protein